MSVKVRERRDKTGKSKGWYVLTDWNGQRKAKYFGKDEKQAKKFAEKLEARLKWAEQSGETIVLTQPEQAMPTVKIYLQDWLNTYAKVHCKPSTYRGYKRSVEKQLIPALGHYPLHGMKRDHVKRFVASKAEELVARAKKSKEEAPELIPARKKARWTIQGYLVPLKAAAGAFGDPQHIEDDSFEWVAVESRHRLRKGMFVAQVVGKSMEPAIPDGAYCLFRAPVEGTRQGKTVLVQLRDAADPETGQRYTVKRYESEKAAKGNSWRHERITLKPINKDFEPIVLTGKDKGEFEVIAELVEVLG